MNCTTRSTLPRLAAVFLLLLTPWLASGCATPVGSPPLADLQAVTERKPVPGDEIATNPAAEAHYNAAVESWGDRVSSAGGRLCRFFQRQGVKVGCP